MAKKRVPTGETRWNTALRDLMKNFDRKRQFQHYTKETEKSIRLSPLPSRVPLHQFPENHPQPQSGARPWVVGLLIALGLSYLSREALRIRHDRSDLGQSQVVDLSRAPASAARPAGEQASAQVPLLASGAGAQLSGAQPQGQPLAAQAQMQSQVPQAQIQNQPPLAQSLTPVQPQVQPNALVQQQAQAVTRPALAPVSGPAQVTPRHEARTTVPERRVAQSKVAKATRRAPAAASTAASALATGTKPGVKKRSSAKKKSAALSSRPRP